MSFKIGQKYKVVGKLKGIDESGLQNADGSRFGIGSVFTVSEIDKDGDAWSTDLLCEGVKAEDREMHPLIQHSLGIRIPSWAAVSIHDMHLLEEV